MTTQTDARFAVYLIPPYKIARDVAEIHHMLRKQFGFIEADQFQVHATLKGFFKKVDGPLAPLTERLDAIFADQAPFPVHFSGYRIDKGGIGLDIDHQDEQTNQPLMALRERVVEATRPFIAPDCEFVASDLGRPFQAHITLAFYDIPQTLYDDVLAYLQDAPLPTDPFIADTFHFLSFFSPDWSANWGPTLTWRLLKSWRLLKA